MATVNREELLRTLEMLQPGLATREAIEQSKCFAFVGGDVCTYDDETSVRMPSKLPNMADCAVPAKALLELLRKLPEVEIDVRLAGGELLIAGKSRKAGIAVEKDVLLPIQNVERPKKWVKLHEEFAEAVGIVQECAGKDETQFSLTCVHVHPKWVEACDNFRATRYKLETGVSEPCLVRRDSLKHVVGLGAAELAETKSWLHFRNPAGLVLSCRRSLEEYHDLGEFLKSKGSPATLPKGLAEAAEKAEVFSAENAEDNLVSVELRPGKLRIRGQGVSGWYQESKKIAYDGQPLHFLISPKLLGEITRKHNECSISDRALIVNGGKFKFVTCLIDPAAVQRNGTADDAAEPEEAVGEQE